MAVVRYRYRLRPGATALAALTDEWDRCRWVWNHAVARLNKSGEWVSDEALTGWRDEHKWLGEGSVMVLVSPAYTTMTCSGCGAKAKSPLLLSQRVFACENCGMIEDRDRNAARVILDRAGLNPAGAEAVRHSDLLEVRVHAESGIPALEGGEDVKT